MISQYIGIISGVPLGAISASHGDFFSFWAIIRQIFHKRLLNCYTGMWILHILKSNYHSFSKQIRVNIIGCQANVPSLLIWCPKIRCKANPRVNHMEITTQSSLHPLKHSNTIITNGLPPNGTKHGLSSLHPLKHSNTIITNGLPPNGIKRGLQWIHPSFKSFIIKFIKRNLRSNALSNH